MAVLLDRLFLSIMTEQQRKEYAKLRGFIFTPEIPTDWQIEIDIAYRDGKQIAEAQRRSNGKQKI